MDVQIQHHIKQITPEQKVKLLDVLKHMVANKEYTPSVRNITVKRKRMWEYLKEAPLAAAPAAPAGSLAGGSKKKTKKQRRSTTTA
jgi:hypothetical protein